MLILRDYQKKLTADIYAARDSGARAVLATSPCGSGKTAVYSNILHQNQGPSVCIAHRSELISQNALSLGKWGVPHNILSPDKVVRLAVERQMKETGSSHVRPGAPVSVASVGTLKSRADKLKAWARSVTLVVVDEAHHVLRDNQWGQVLDMFSNAWILGVTASPTRTDKKGLGAQAEGVFQELVHGPSMRDLINDGHLCDYRLFVPPSTLDLSGIKVTSSGDYSKKEASDAVLNSSIVGDVVSHYLDLARGKRGMTFTCDVKTANLEAERFRAAGVPAKSLSWEDSERRRVDVMNAFRAGDLLQVVSCDLLGEGVDVPAIEVVQFARPTMSRGLFIQQFGRALRPMEGKGKALIIDHVGNVKKHGLPDGPQAWSLDRQIRRSKKNDTIKVKTCLKCWGAFEAHLGACPYCGYYPVPTERSSPKQVEGVLEELDEHALALLRADVGRVDMEPDQYLNLQRRKGNPYPHAAHKRHIARQVAQGGLREVMSYWSGWLDTQKEYNDRQKQRLFFHRFGLSVIEAQALNKKAALELTEKIIMEVIA